MTRLHPPFAHPLLVAASVTALCSALAALLTPDTRPLLPALAAAVAILLQAVPGRFWEGALAGWPAAARTRWTQTTALTLLLCLLLAFWHHPGSAALSGLQWGSATAAFLMAGGVLVLQRHLRTSGETHQ